jgi:hypothetical protein
MYPTHMVPLGAPAVLSHTRLTTRFAFFSFVFIAASNDVKDANKRTKKNTRNHYANPLISKRIFMNKKEIVKIFMGMSSPAAGYATPYLKPDRIFIASY